jgi:protein associated with RNAse G/E
MATYITIIDLFNQSTSVEIDSEKRDIYEQIILRFFNENDVNTLCIISKNGDEYYIPKELAKKFVIKINTEY